MLSRKIKCIHILIPLCIFALSGCTSRESIKIPYNKPLPHGSLYRIGSFTLKRVNGELHFGQNRKYMKRGVNIAVLKGTPYEIGYSRGILLREEIEEWVKNMLYAIRKRSIGTSIGKNWMIRRAKKIDEFVPSEYREELRGMSDATEIDYHTLLMVNLLETIAHQFGCTSVAVKCSDGQLFRSHNQDGKKNSPYLGTWYLIIYKPTKGNAFVSVSAPGFIGVWTGMNENGLTFGSHNISGVRVPNAWQGITTAILNLKVLQYATSMKDAEIILKKLPRCAPRMFMVANARHARIYEYDSKRIVCRDIRGDHLVLTNHTEKLHLGPKYPHSIVRFEQAQDFLVRNKHQMDLDKLIQLNRLDNISWAFDPYTANWNSTIFRPETLDFWTAIQSPPASRRKYVGFSLMKESYGRGNDPTPIVIPAIDITKHMFY